MPTPAAARPATRTWRVDYTAFDPSDGRLAERQLCVDAAYLRRDGPIGPEFLEFVDGDHKTSAVVGADHVITVERLHTADELRDHIDRLTRQLAATEANN